MLVHLHCKPFAFSRPVKINYFLFASTLVPQNCWEYLLRPSRRGVTLHCKHFCIFGPRAQSKVCYFSFASTLRPQKTSWSIYCPFREGGEKLDGVSSTSLRGVGLGPPGISPSFLVDFALACCVSSFVLGGMTVQFPKRLEL